MLIRMNILYKELLKLQGNTREQQSHVTVENLPTYFRIGGYLC